jgi:hypothetical protein
MASIVQTTFPEDLRPAIDDDGVKEDGVGKHSVDRESPEA